MRYICFAAVFLCFGLPARAADRVNGVNVLVNDAVITYEQVDGRVLPFAQTLSTQYRSDPKTLDQKVQQLRADTLQVMVEEKLILNEFKTAGYMLPESFIEDAIRDKIKREFYGDRTLFTKTMQSRGLTYEMARQLEREHFIVEVMRRQNVSVDKILISPAKIEDYYNAHKDEFKMEDQVKLRMIVINQAPTAEPGTAKKIAHEVLAKIEEGVSFAEMATIYSSGSQRTDGGDRGWVDRSYFKPELAQIAFSLKSGQHSGVVELAEACYLIQVDDVRPAHVRALPEVRQEVENTLKGQEQKRLQKKWIDRLKAKAFVRYFS